MKLIQLNIERNKHLSRFLPFLENEMPDVVCLQEVMQSDLPRIEQDLSMCACFAPMAVLSGYSELIAGDIMGIAILSRTPLRIVGEHYYVGSRDTLTVYEKSMPDTRNKSIYKVLLIAEALVAGGAYVIGTTHFTWSYHGECDEPQKTSFKALSRILDAYPSLILAGDFNIPRATNELYQPLAAMFTDSVPRAITSSMDPVLHRAPLDQRHMVDYIWSRGDYRVENVRMVSGVSDHCALVGDVWIRADASY